MNRLALLTILTLSVACGGGDLTRGDGIDTVAEGFCLRLETCAPEVGYDPPSQADLDFCMDHNRFHLCANLEEDAEGNPTGLSCSDQLPDFLVPMVKLCEEELQVQECVLLAFLGAIPESCGELL